MRAKSFAKCETCGSHGHFGKGCPVYNLNLKQEKEHSKIINSNISLGLTPDLERQIERIRAAWKAGLATACVVMLLSVLGVAGTVTGQIQTATGGNVNNGTLTFRLSQPAVISGTASIVTTPAACYTSSSGNIVGVPDPLVLSGVTTNTASGTLAAGTYYTKITYIGAGGESIASPETTTVLSAQGTLIVAAPILHPPSATGYNVYIGSTSGSETLQASVTGFTSYSQTSSLSSSAVPPTSNTSVCSIAFSDQLIPSGTYYTVSLVNRNGSTISGFPQTWCTYGGQSGTINVSNGAPTGNCGTNGVLYPTPIMANPQNNAPQSISSPITFAGAVALNAAVTETLSHSLINAGTFTNTQMNLYLQSLINGCNPFSEYQSAQGANTTTEPVTGCLTVPSGSTVHQADAGGFYISNSSPSTNAVALYSQSRCLANGTTCWGANFVSRDVGGLTTGITLYGNEIDVNPLNPTSAYSGINGFLMNLNTSQTGTFPGNGAFYVTASLNAKWQIGFQTNDNAAATGMLLGGACVSSGTCASQPINFRSFNGGVLATATLNSDATGNIVLTPASGQAVKIGSNVVPATPLLLISPTAPTVSSGFGTSPSIVNSNGSAVFEVNVGTGGVATSGVIGLPTATNGWGCLVQDMNTNIVTRETAFTVSSVTLTAASAWTASDKLIVQCEAF